MRLCLNSCTHSVQLMERSENSSCEALAPHSEFLVVLANQELISKFYKAHNTRTPKTLFVRFGEPLCETDEVYLAIVKVDYEEQRRITKLSSSCRFQAHQETPNIPRRLAFSSLFLGIAQPLLPLVRQGSRNA